MPHNQSVFPARGRPWSELKVELGALKAGDIPWHQGRTHATAFHANDEVYAAVSEAYGTYLTENGLYAGRSFKSLGRMEAEVLTMAAEILGGDSNTAGILTLGGTDSIITAMKSARDRWRAGHGGAGRPVIVCPYSAHPAFNKAAALLGMTVRRVALDGWCADVEAMAQAMDDRTAALIASAPCWPYGIFDPITELAELANTRGVWFHVDACVGGFIAPFVRKAGWNLPPFDLSIPGVDSISADLHKYGYAAKNVSVLLFRNAALKEFARFRFDDWPFGTYDTYTYSGSRTGGAIAGAWTVLNLLGEAGYVDLARTAMQAKETISRGIGRIPGLEIRGRPPLTLMAFGSSAVDIMAVAEAMERRDWYPNRCRQPPSLHLVLNPVHAPHAEAFLAVLEECVEEVRGKKISAAATEVRYN